jgi:hypothetical protein
VLVLVSGMESEMGLGLGMAIRSIRDSVHEPGVSSEVE